MTDFVQKLHLCRKGGLFQGNDGFFELTTGCGLKFFYGLLRNEVQFAKVDGL